MRVAEGVASGSGSGSGGGPSDEVVAALAALAPEQRAVIVLRHLLGFTPGEIARVLGLPRGNGELAAAARAGCAGGAIAGRGDGGRCGQGGSRRLGLLLGSERGEALVSKERRTYDDGPRGDDLGARVHGDDLDARLRGVDVPGAPESGRASVGRRRRGVRARRPVRRRRRRLAPGLAVAVVLGVLMLAVAAGATQPGAAVRGFVVRVLGGDPAPAPRARIGPLPPGRMLVTSPRGAWIVGRDGSRTLLGPYAGASWSPRGLFVVAWSGADIRAVAPDGTVHWTLRTPGRVAAAAWSPDGYRVAYRRAGGLGVVAGDGSGARVLSASVAPAGPAWRPGAPHTLAWVDPEGRIVVRDVDSGALVWRSPSGVGAARALSWSADGRLALVRSTDGLRLADPGANRVSRVRLPSGDRAVAAAWAPRGRRLAVVARAASGDLTRVLVAQGGVRIADRPVFTTTGRLASPAWSPDGSRVLVRWTDADEWLLLPTVSPGDALRPVRRRPLGRLPARGIVAIAPVARRFGGMPVVRGWCCAG